MLWMKRLSILWGAILVASACTFDGSNQGSLSNDGGVSVDARDNDASTSLDAGVVGIDGPLGCQNFATHFNACLIAEDSDDLILGDTGEYTYNTTDGILEDPSGSKIEHLSTLVSAAEGDIRVLVTGSFLLGGSARLRAEGRYPLAIGAYGELVVEGTIDVSQGGAGARDQCGTSNGADGGDENAGAGGGGGGGFQGAGGNGGMGNEDGNANNQGAIGLGGVAAGQPASPLGGCPGGDGGDGEDDGGNGGLGGGAIYLASGTQLLISGIVNAAGSGGEGGDERGGGFADAGGAGGGSGGHILLEAPALSIAGILAANGGGGGEGSGNGEQGNNGVEGGASSVAAFGGFGGSSTGSDGASGSVANQLNGGIVSVSEAGGAGGGGGGAGFIQVIGSNPSQSGIVSPPWI